jgi:multidrug efflux pump subunit AcrA (membrane-fusion protein)
MSTSSPQVHEPVARPAPSRTTRGIALAGILAVLFIGYKVMSRPVPTLPGAPAGSPPAGGSGGGSGGGQKGPGNNTGLPVVPAAVRQKDMLQVLQVTGTLRTDQDVRVGSRIAGKVVRVDVKEGDRVRPGQLLVTLDDSEINAQLARAQGAYRAAKAKQSQLVNGREARISELKQGLEQAKAGVRSAQAKLEQAKSAASVTETQIDAQEHTAEENLKAAKERYKMVQDGAREQEKAQAALAVQQAQVEMLNAQAFYDRRAQLFSRGLIAREEVDEAGTKRQVAEAAYKAAKERQSMTMGSRTEEVRVAEAQFHAAEQALNEARGARSRKAMSEQEVRSTEAQLAQAQAARDTAQAALTQLPAIDDEIHAAEAAVAQSQADIAFYQTQKRDTKVYAPVRGVISAKMVNPGETVSPNAPLMNIVAMEAIYLEAQVPELDLGQVRQGLTASVTIDSLPSKKFIGTLREIIPVADPAVKAFRVRVALVARAGDPPFPAGSFARADIHVGRRQGALVIPKSAIKSEMGQRFVYTIVNGCAKRTSIQVGLTDDTNAEVLQGLALGDQVIAVGSPAIADGTPVTTQAQTEK